MHINGLVHDCGMPIVKALEIPHSYTKPPAWYASLIKIPLCFLSKISQLCQWFRPETEGGASHIIKISHCTVQGIPQGNRLSLLLDTLCSRLVHNGLNTVWGADPSGRILNPIKDICTINSCHAESISGHMQIYLHVLLVFSTDEAGSWKWSCWMTRALLSLWWEFLYL